MVAFLEKVISKYPLAPSSEKRARSGSRYIAQMKSLEHGKAFVHVVPWHEGFGIFLAK